MSLQLYGSAEPLPVQTPLRAGPVSMMLENGMLRYVRLGGQEVVRGIYFALRDQNWGTVPYRLEAVEEQIGADTFTIRYQAIHTVGGHDVFRWAVSLTGEANGTVRFSIAGTCLYPFARNRAGFCVLHPVAECAGQPVRLTQPGRETTDGPVTDDVFPKLVVPDRPFPYLRAMQWPVATGATATLTFEGDDFETEDQRNWTDTSYKTFCTPLYKPFPVELQPGDVVEQAVTLTFEGLPETAPAISTDKPLTVTVSDVWHALPRLGTLQALGTLPLTDTDVSALRELNLSHYRADLRLDEADWTAHYQRAAHEAARLGTSLWLGLTFSAQAVDEARQFLIVWRQHEAPIDTILIFGKEAYATPTGTLQAVVGRLRQGLPGVRIGAGTQTNYTELGRNPFEADGLDLVTFGVQPQEHAFDLASLVENLESQGDVVASARALYPGQAVVVSPLTLRKRYNPYARHLADRWPEQPEAVQHDPRYGSYFGAGWLLGSLGTLANAEATDVTVFRTKGPGGLLSPTGHPTPAYRVMQWLGGLPTAQVRSTQTSNKLTLSTLCLKTEQGRHWLVANHTRQSVQVQLPGETPTTWQRLSGESITSVDGLIDLPPFEVVCSR